MTKTRPHHPETDHLRRTITHLRGEVEGLEEVQRKIAALERELEESFGHIEQGREEWLAAMDALPDLVVLLDGEERIIRANLAYARRAGLAVTDIIGRPYRTVFPKGDGPSRPCPHVQDIGPPVVEEFRVEETGETFLCRTFPVRMGSDPEELSFVRIMQDITRQRSAEDALTRSETRFRRIVETAQEGIWAVDREARTTFANARMAEMLGCSVDDMLGASIFDFMDSEVRAIAVRRWARRQARIAETHEVRLRRTDGADLWALVSATPILDERNTFAGGLAMIADITDRKRMETRLRDSEARLRAVIGAIPDLLFVMDEEGRYIEVLTAHESLLCASADTLRGRLMHDILPAEAADEFLAFVRRTIDSSQAKTLEYTLDVPAGRRCFEGRSEPMDVAVDGKRACVFLARDITDRVEAESSLRQAQKMEALGNLAGGIAHDINNLLLPVITLSEMTVKRLPAGTDRDRLDKVVEAGRRAKDLVASILAFSRRDEGEAQHEPMDIATVLSGTLRLIRSTIPSSIRITEDLDPATGTVVGDASQISTVLMNLASNAADAMEGLTGEIRVSLVPVTVDAVVAERVADLRPGAYARLTVADGGSGMDAATLARMFDPFFTTKEVGRGTGLGLAMAHGIVTKHDGAIDVTSAPGAGTTFDIYLPVSTKAQTG